MATFRAMLTRHWIGNLLRVSAVSRACRTIGPSAVYNLDLKIGLKKPRSQLMEEDSTKKVSEWRILVAGASAGLVVDSVLFPLDTVKSRLQSKLGFKKSGGFKNLYRGITPVLTGSVPNAALFFITYESIKDQLHHYKHLAPGGKAHAINHILAASAGEVVSCTVRVPYEIVKMRSQTSLGQQVSTIAITKDILVKEGLAGLYRGFHSTVMRDLPFSAIQFPIWEKLKSRHLRRHNQSANIVQSAYYGSIAGAVSALITTPLDVAKTRIMLADTNDSLASGSVPSALRRIYSEKGVSGLFAGVVPRVLWISAGAAIFLGTYEKALKILK